MHDISESLGGLLCNILPEVHALAGCDTASAICMGLVKRLS